MLWGVTPHRFLQAGRERKVGLFTSSALLLELTDILAKPKFGKKVAATRLTIDQIVDRYASMTAVGHPVLTPRIVNDPDDDVVIGTALAAHADIIVSGDNALLKLQEYQGIRIMNPASAIALIELPR